MKAIGERIKQARGSLGMSRRRLAEKLGVDLAIVRRIEDGARAPTTLELVKVSETLGVSLSSLLTGAADQIPAVKARPEDQDPIAWARRVALNYLAMQHRAQELGIA